MTSTMKELRDRLTQPWTAGSLRTWRQDHKLSQQEVADQLGVTRGMVGHWETGRHPLTRRTVRQLDQLADRLTPRH